MGAKLVPMPQTEPEVCETAEGVFLVAPDGTVLEKLVTNEDDEDD